MFSSSPFIRRSILAIHFLSTTFVFISSIVRVGYFFSSKISNSANAFLMAAFSFLSFSIRFFYCLCMSHSSWLSFFLHPLLLRCITSPLQYHVLRVILSILRQLFPFFLPNRQCLSVL